MIEQVFVKENITMWKNFESILKKLSSSKLSSFKDGELDNFISNYNIICGHLSYARTYFSNTDTEEFLNNIVATAHSYIYTSKSSVSKTIKLKKFFMFFIRDFPLLVRANMIPLFISALLFILAIAVSFSLTVHSTDNLTAFFPTDVSDSLNSDNVGKNTATIKSAMVSSEILTNNIRVDLLSFSLGLTLGIGTAYVLIQNGFILGGLAAVAFKNKINLLFWSLILPHGILEIFGIFVCGGAGFIIGYSIINPGKYSRVDSAIIKTKLALKLVLGTIPLTIVAGIIEGYFTPSSVDPVIKIIFSILTFVFLISYIVVPNLIWHKHYKELKHSAD